MKPAPGDPRRSGAGRDFPGYFAGASLKLGLVDANPYCMPWDFPGYFAGASLKHGVVDETDAVVYPTSPATSPGPH